MGVCEKPICEKPSVGVSHDLHCHSDQSDGILSPEALVSRAKAQGVTVLALTDHDCTTGLKRARQQARIESLDLISGVEFSSQWRGHGIHIVGLNFDPDHPGLQAAVAKQAQKREQRAAVIAERLQARGAEISVAEVRQYAKDGAIGRPHFGQCLVDKGYVKNLNQAFKKYLGAGKPGDVKQHWPEIDEVVSWIKSARGHAVLAHPAKYKMTWTKLCAMVSDFVSAGGEAVEVVSGYQTPNVTRDMARLAQKYGLFASCGSDFHGPDQQWQELGRFSPLPDGLEPIWSIW